MNHTEFRKLLTSFQSKTSSPASRVLPRRNTEPVHILYSDTGQLAPSIAETVYSTSQSLEGAATVADRRSTLSIYLLCRILIEVYSQSSLKSITAQMAGKLEDIIYGQLQRVEPEQLETSSFRLANWNIFCQLLGVMSDLNFHSVSRRFAIDLKALQKDISSQGVMSRESEGRLELTILAMKHLRIKTQSENAWKESCEFLYTLAELFVQSHGQPIKHAYCRILEQLVLPVAASTISQLHTFKWRDFQNTVNPRLTQMLVKPRHWLDAFPLSVTLLCASTPESFAAQWLSVVTSLQSKLKDRMTRSTALQSICRLVWTYLFRISEPPSTVMRKLEDVVKIVLPSGKKAYLSTDPAFAEPIIELIRVIGFRCQDFCFRTIIFPLVNSDLFVSGKDIKVEQLEPERIVVGIRAFLAIMADLEQSESGRPPFPYFNNEGRDSDFLPDSSYPGYSRPSGLVQGQPANSEDAFTKPVLMANLDEATKDYYARFCEILGKIILICDNAFGGQAVLDEKFGGLTPKTPMAETFGFGRRDEHAGLTEHRQGFYDLLHVSVQALPRCLSVDYIPFNPVINLLCTGTAHVQSNIAVSSARALKSIARQSRAQPITMGFARFIFNFDMRYSTMSDDGLLGPGHIENTLKLYVELLHIWIQEIKHKTESASSEQLSDGSTATRSLPLDLTTVCALVEEVESHGVFFLCSQSRRVRSFAVNVLRLATEFDTALGKDNPRIIHLLDGDYERVIDPNDDRLSVAERSRLQKGKRKSVSQTTLIELCSSEVSYDSTLWFKIFPNLIRLSFEICPTALTLGREIVCARLLQMGEIVTALSESTRGPQTPASDLGPTRTLNRLGATPPEVIIEQWKMYLVMACTTLTNAGAQTQSQLANLQHARNKSKSPQHGQDKISSARSLFAYIIPLLSAGPSSIRDAIVIALGSINNHLYRTLLESLQYAVTTCNEDAKMRTHQRTGSNPRRNRRIDCLRTEVTHVYKLTSLFLREPEVLRDEWILGNLRKYTDDLRLFLSDTEVQNDWEFQKLRRHYCGLMEELFEAINRTEEPSRWMSFEARKSSFALMEDWCGYSPNQSQISQREDSMKQSALDQHQDTGEKTNVTAAMEIERWNLRTAALSAMATLCGGPIQVIADSGQTLSFDIRRMLSWIDQIFSTKHDKLHAIGRRALRKLIVYNKGYPYLLETSVEMCYVAHRPKALESYFEVVTQVLMEHTDYPLAFWRVLGAVLCTLGNEKSHIRMKSARLLRTLEQRQQRSSKLQDFDISISDKTTAVYKLAQFEISKRLAKKHSELAFLIFSQFSLHYKTAHPDHQRNMVAAILPWIQTMDLQLQPGGTPTVQTHMLLANLLEITTKSSTALHNEVQALWQALATGPHGGNVQVVLDFVISLCLDKREQSFVDYAKQIVVFLSSTPAGQRVVEFLLLQITPRNMVQQKRDSMQLPSDSMGLPYIADFADALPIGNRQAGFSLGQLSLILLVDLMVAPINLAKDSVPLLVQVCAVLWDHNTILVQEQAREMLIHLIHELVISKLEDDIAGSKKNELEDFIESIRQNEAKVVWTYEESNGKDDEDDENRVPASMHYMTNEVVNLFALTYPDIHEQWAKTTLSWATSCTVRHLACRSFQIFRCILSSLDKAMLADMLARLSNTIADEAGDIQTFAMEILTTLKAIVGALEPANLLKYPQLFWATCACLNTTNEREFIETLGMLEKLLTKVNLSDPAVIKILQDAKPENWDGGFEGITPLVYKGLKSAMSAEKSLIILGQLAPLPDSDLVGHYSRLLFGVLANLPRFLHTFEKKTRDMECVTSARVLSSCAETDGYKDISAILNAFADARYPSSKDFLTQLVSALRQAFFPSWELKCLVFLMGLLTNRLPWYKVNTMEILCVIIPDIDMRRPEVACHGSDIIQPLLRLLQTEYCSQALEVMDHILVMSATPMDKHHLRMSMASSGSRSIRKEYERTQSLYGIPEDTGWSIPMPAIRSETTRANVRAICSSANLAEADAIVTPEVEFHAEDGSYFPLERTGTMISEDPRADLQMEGNMSDLVSKLDSLDDFFEDNLTAENKYLSGFSDVTITGFSIDSGSGADLYDQQTAPILHKSLARTASTSSLNNTFADTRGSANRDPKSMNPIAFTMGLGPAPTNAESLSAAPTSQPRPTLHSRSVTSPNNVLPRSNGSDLLSDSEIDEVFSDDDRSIGNSGQPIFQSMIRRSKSTARKLTPGAAGREYRQRGDLLRAQARSKIQAPNSPEVPKVPEAYLQTAKITD